MVKPTSLAALNQLVLGGKCKTQRERIFELLVYSPCTRKEIAASLDIELSAVCGRVKELLDSSCIRVNKTRKCNQSNNQAEELTV